VQSKPNKAEYEIDILIPTVDQNIGINLELICSDKRGKVDFNFIKSALNGIGRIYQISTDVNTFYEGEIKDGEPHGFGRLLNNDSMECYTGFFKNGESYGFSI